MQINRLRFGNTDVAEKRLTKWRLAADASAKTVERD
jgi:hypothetical protein